MSSRKKSKATRKGNESSAPVAISKLIRSSNPNISSSGGDIRIRHRELVQDVHTNADGSMHEHYLEANPGLYSSFPWLSAIAQRFESYTFQSLSLEYVPMCGTNSSGVVMMAPDYDVSDWMPEDVISISSYPGCVRSSLWSPCRMDCDPRCLQKMVKERYVRSDSIADVDLKLYDAACLYVYTYGHNAAITAGSIWASYDVILRTPSMDTSVADEDCGKVFGGGVISKAAPLGTVPAVANGAAGEPVLEVPSSTTIHFKRPGKYLVNAIFGGTGLTNATPAYTFASALDGAETIIGGIADAAATNGWYDAMLTVLRPCVVTLASAAAWTTVTASQLRVAPYKLG